MTAVTADDSDLRSDVAPVEAAADDTPPETARPAEQRGTASSSGPMTVYVAHPDTTGWYLDRPREVDALTAAVADRIPVEPPADWFDPDQVPEVDGPLTFTADGRVYGLLAPRDIDHIGLPGQHRRAPYSASGYSLFHTGQVRCDDGTLVATGRLTMLTGHADLDLTAAGAAAHYDHTGSAVADVVAWDTPSGIMCAGAARPGVTPEQMRMAMASPPSGDWRPVNGRDLEMVAALLVNTAGFPTSRAAMAASGAPLALIASGAAPFRLAVPVDSPAAKSVVAAPMGPDSDRNRDQAGNASKPVPPAPKPAPPKPAAKKATAKSSKAPAKKAPAKSGGGGGGSFDEAKHPRDVQGQWAPKNEDAKKAQQDPNAKKNYGLLESGGKGAADMLGKLSDNDLRALTKFAYSSKTSDPKIVAARVKVAGEMGKRGIDIKKNGAAGGGKKSATRASALVAARRSGGGGKGGGGGYRYRHGWVLLDGSDDGAKGSGKASGGEAGRPSFNDTAAALRREPLEKALDDLAKTQPETARRQREAVDELAKAGKLTPERERRATEAAKRAAVPYGHEKAGGPTEGLGADKFGPGKSGGGEGSGAGKGGSPDPAGKVLERDGEEQTKAIRDLSDDDLFTAHKELYAARGQGGHIEKTGNRVRGEMARRGTATKGDGVNSALDRVRDNSGANREKTLQGLSRAQLHQVGLAAQKRSVIARSPSEKTDMDDVREAVRGELARRKPVAAAAAGRSDDMDDDLIDDFEETTVDEQQHDEPDAVTAASDDEGAAPTFEEGDMVAIGETGLSGQVVADALDEDPTTMAVVVSVPASMLSKMDEPLQADPAVAAAVAPLAASVAGLTELVASMQAERRSERAAKLLDGLPA